MSRGPDAGTLLRRAIVREAAAQGCVVEAAETGMTRWASATFTGARHRLTLTGAASAGLDALLARLPEAELPLQHHLVADVAVLTVTQRRGAATVEIEALTVED